MCILYNIQYVYKKKFHRCWIKIFFSGEKMAENKKKET